MERREATPFTALLADYCRSLGIDGSATGPEGGLFEVDGVSIAVTVDEDFDRLSMTASVAPIAPEKLPQLAAGLLQLNAASGLSGGQTFSADRASGEVRLQQSLPLTRLTTERFGLEIGVMAEKCRAARELLARLEQVAETAVEAAGESIDAEGEEEPFLTFRA